MPTREIKQEEWHSFFDSISKKGNLEKKRAKIEVISLNIGDQLAAESLPIFGIVYEPKSDTIEIGLEGLTHMIHHPKKVYIEEDALELCSVNISDENDIQHIIRLHDPMTLPPPE
ncbi:MAG: hypothetical protein K0R08_1127 [Solimicrobium sp.]|jgi:hypothetical protein|nr:hypothetical protein [Solimicrobium sp.]